MGFHCGNTPACKLCADRAVKYQLIQHRLLEPAGSDPDFTRGTLEGDIAPSDITFYPPASATAKACCAATLPRARSCPSPPAAFGGIGVFAIPRDGPLLPPCAGAKSTTPHHGAVAFGHYGKLLFEVFKYFGLADIAYNQPKALPYPTENPWA